MVNEVELDDSQRQIFEKITKNDYDGLKAILSQYKKTVNFIEENGMSPLQHACYKGSKDAVQLLLDQGADVNYSEHGANYTSLHFAALSGNKDIVLMLLNAGANPNTLNSVSRTAAQMAAFVGNHACAAIINNFIPKTDVEYYTKLQGQQTEPYLPAFLLDSFHKFITQINIHPVRIALNLQKYGLTDHLKKIKKVLELMTEKEMKKKYEVNEVMAFKYHYLSWIVGEIIRCQEHFQSRKDQQQGGEMRHDFVELFAKRVLKENKMGQLDYLEYTIRDCAREFPFRECTIFRQVVSQLANKDCPPALDVLKSAINGHRGFVDDITYCSSCGEEKPDKKCSKCKEVQYCDRECQRLHWFMHKKNCARPTSNSTSTTTSHVQNATKKDIDTTEIREQLQNLVAS